MKVGITVTVFNGVSNNDKGVKGWTYLSHNPSYEKKNELLLFKIIIARLCNYEKNLAYKSGSFTEEYLGSDDALKIIK